MENRNNRPGLTKLIPVMLTFFTMGFVDLVGISTNYIQADFALSDKEASFFPSMVFFWFLIGSVPTGMLMNRIGRKKTVLLSLVVTAAALLLPVVAYDKAFMLVSFCLLGIGNTLMQVSLNPLVSNIVNKEKLASTLTLGQFVKAIASFLAPIIAGYAALHWGNWRMLYPLFTAISLLAVLALGATRIREEDEKGSTSTFGECFSLLGDRFILLAFIGIVCHVGIDVGMNLTAPKLLIDRAGMTLAEAGYATSLYFLFRTVGSFTGAFALTRCPARTFFAVSVAIMAAAMAGLLFLHGKFMIYACIALIGLGNSNVFSIIFAQAMLHMPHKKNEVSGLMIMGLFGGTIFPIVMGVASDALSSQSGAVAVMAVGVVYLLYLSKKFSLNR
ncbi:MFS transporter [uncultured Alistipes sp.]|uniref:MFS transporter n=1 Tax=uncultured Alistipes sp. TaxID=538949 RepID=UPI0026237632|nr:MFS transporter [uncultured Alistipes sp.]